ncbi:MAG: LysR family transcriptional regulator [Treponema sp.]|jgi:lysyl-tRNA synthetase class 2|nr:LysR family transcriptional regulator [Treponema sp.]
MDSELLRFRAAVFREIRRFFDRRSYLEVDTPLLSPDLIPESCLEVFETRRLRPDRNREPEPYWLVPSPEIWMKKLIARHRQSLYQICKCFRNGESSGRFHSPEFTMLEYYTMGAGYLDSLAITEDLFAQLLGCLNPAGNSAAGLRARALPADPALAPPFQRLSMGEAFGRWAGFDLYEAAAFPGGLEAEARRLGLEPPPGLGTGALYDLIFIHAVEPEIPRDRALAITDYPAFAPCLAKKSPGGKTAERWELYVRGIELANCYSEETGPEEVRRFFASEAAAKEKSALMPHRVDPDYWKLFLPKPGAAGPFPPFSGVAMGLDRLVMALAGRSAIDSVLPFPMG